MREWTEEQLLLIRIAPTISAAHRGLLNHNCSCSWTEVKEQYVKMRAEANKAIMPKRN